MIITIDGPAGSGKSTVASILAKRIDFIHFNSGSLYRGVCAYLREQNFDFDTLDENFVFDNLNVSTKYIDDQQHVFVEGVDCTSHLRDNEVSILTPKISINRSLRTLIDKCQRDFGRTHNIVIDGRDSGSHVFPDADYKFYLDCDIKERALRRYKEEVSKNNNSISLEKIEKEIAERDYIDRNKPFAKLVIPSGAIIIDSTCLSIEQVVSELLKYINPKVCK